MRTLLICLCLGLAGCTAKFSENIYKYKFALLPSDEIGGTIDTASVQSYTDDKIDASFEVENTFIKFSVKNKTNDLMMIIWDEASITQNNKSKKIIHSGIDYKYRYLPQAPTEIKPQTSYDDTVLPAENVYWRDGFEGEYSRSSGTWEKRELFPTSDLGKEENRNLILNTKDQKFSLTLPIQYKDKTLVYSFNFIVTDVLTLNLLGGTK